MWPFCFKNLSYTYHGVPCNLSVFNFAMFSKRLNCGGFLNWRKMLSVKSFKSSCKELFPGQSTQKIQRRLSHASKTTQQLQKQLNMHITHNIFLKNGWRRGKSGMFLFNPNSFDEYFSHLSLEVSKILNFCEQVQFLVMLILPILAEQLSHFLSIVLQDLILL